MKDLGLTPIEKRKLKKEVEECKIKKCQKNTQHLWRVNYRYRNQSKWTYADLDDL